MKIFLIDIDGTVCENVKNEEGLEAMRNAKPFKDSIGQINKWYDEGNYICFFTARTDEHKKVTEEWLKRNNIKFNQVIFNKPRKIRKFVEYHFIDDTPARATTFKGKFSKLVKKNVEIEVFED